jgi:hypothetical protein
MIELTMGALFHKAAMAAAPISTLLRLKRFPTAQEIIS